MCYKQLSVGGPHELDIRLLLIGELDIECRTGDSGDIVTQFGECICVLSAGNALEAEPSFTPEHKSFYLHFCNLKK